MPTIDLLSASESNPEKPAHLDGVIITGADSTAAAKRLRSCRPDLVVLVEPAKFASVAATDDAPFALANDGLFEQTLNSVIDDQLISGAPYAITPTGYVRSYAPEALKAIVQQANEVDTDRLILTVPIDATWLAPNRHRQLVVILQRSAHPVLLALGSKRDPLNTERARGLVAVLGALERASVARADHLIGLEWLARTNGSASFGLIPSRRRITPPSENGDSFFKHDRREHTFHQPIHRFLAGPTSDEWFANAPNPTCDGVCCKGGRLSFTASDDDKNAAKNHNAQMMLELAARITGTRQERLIALAGIYLDAATEHHRWSALIGQRLTVPKAQQVLATLAAPQPANVHTTSP